MDVSILIVSYNTAELLDDCLRSIAAETQGIGYEVIVVDNASADDSVARVRANHPGVKLVPLDENVGFARGVNLAGEQAQGEFLLLLNPDTAVHDGAIQRLVAFARAHPEHGIYGGRTLRPEGGVDPSSCWGRPTLWSLVCFASGATAVAKRSRWLDPESLGRWDRDSVREVDIVTGCLCLVPSELWKRLGGFDERYFMYGEDTDLCLRAAEQGYRPVITPEATVMHVVGAASATRGDKRVMVMRGRATLVRRHFGPLASRLALGLLVAGVGLRAVLSGTGGRGEAESWRVAWRERGRWLAGYPERGAG